MQNFFCFCDLCCDIRICLQLGTVRCRIDLCQSGGQHIFVCDAVRIIIAAAHTAGTSDITAVLQSKLCTHDIAVRQIIICKSYIREYRIYTVHPSWHVVVVKFTKRTFCSAVGVKHQIRKFFCHMRLKCCTGKIQFLCRILWFFCIRSHDMGQIETAGQTSGVFYIIAFFTDQVYKCFRCIVTFVNRHQNRFYDITFWDCKGFNADRCITDKFAFFGFLINNGISLCFRCSFSVFCGNNNGMLSFFHTLEIQRKACLYIITPGCRKCLSVKSCCRFERVVLSISCPDIEQLALSFYLKLVRQSCL